MRAGPLAAAPDVRSAVMDAVELFDPGPEGLILVSQCADRVKGACGGDSPCELNMEQLRRRFHARGTVYAFV